VRILLISSSFSPVLGGLQTVVYQLAAGLVQEGHAVQVVTNRYPRSLPRNEKLDNVPVHRSLFLTPSLDQLKRKRPDLFLASFWFYPIALFELDRILRRIRPEIVNVHYPLNQIPFILALRQRYHFRLVVSLHGDEILPWISEHQDNRPLRSILHQADAITTCSNWLLGQAVSWEPAIQTKATVIHNGVNLERFLEHTAYQHPRPYFFAFGRLSHQKGFDLLLDAFALLATQFPKIDLILAGDGEERDSLLTQTNQVGLEKRVHFFGRAAPDEVVNLLNGCSFMVIPSRWEPFGIVALEGIASGKPILATNVGGLPELFNSADVRSTLVSPTIEDLTTGLRQMLEHVDRQPFHLSKKPTELVDFSWARVVARYKKVFDQAITEQSSSCIPMAKQK
jgi:glycosyltransferase involved in cell wall biosynthesis